MQVRAEGTIGDDEADSAWATATGIPGAAPVAPVVTVEVGDQHLVVSWEAPEEANGATISGYTVRWQKSSPPDVWHSVDQAAVTDLSYTIRELDNGTEYTVQVRAEGTIGDDEVESAWSTGATGSPAVMPDAPGEVEVERGTDATSLMVTW